MTITRPPGRRMRRTSRTVATRSSARHRREEPAGVVDDREVEGAVLERQPRRRRRSRLRRARRPVRPPLRARAADASSGTTATARPDKPTLAAIAAEPPAVRAADLSEAVAQLDAGHADDEHERIIAAVSENIELSVARQFAPADAQLYCCTCTADQLLSQTDVGES